MGIQVARVTFIFYFSCQFFNSFLIRCFSNSVETMLHLLVFHYYLQITSKFDKNLIAVAFWLSIALGIRNTSIVAWVPLLIGKMFFKRAYLSFLVSSIVVTLPTLLLVVALDSIYYGSLTVTAWNFLLINVLENRSSDFGVQPLWFYFTDGSWNCDSVSSLCHFKKEISPRDFDFYGYKSCHVIKGPTQGGQVYPSSHSLSNDDRRSINYTFDQISLHARESNGISSDIVELVRAG
jgi:hypothetical protein